MDDAQYVGAAWAGERWVAVAFTGREYETTSVHDDVGALWARYEEDVEWILVTAPIGLRDDGDDERRCDELAREVVGPLRDSVVSTPVRETVYKQRYQVGARVEKRKTGRDLSEAAWALRKPARQLDSLLQNVPEARHVFLETHPEVCYRAFAGEPLRYGRWCAAAVAERIDALETFESAAPNVVRAAALDSDGDAVAYHDVVDATAAALTGRPGPGELRGLPTGEPPLDDENLPMRIAYRSDEELIS